MERYMEILSMFCAEGVTMRKRLCDCLESGDVENFTIYAHSMKGSCASIGALELSRQALRLEEAGHAGDLEGIGAQLEQFLEDAAALIAHIRAAVFQTEGGPVRNERRPGDETLLGGAIPSLLEAVEKLDMHATQKRIEFLLSHAWPRRTEQALAEVADAILVSDFDAAVRRIRSLERALEA